jgi:hypothetical protein
MAALSFNFQLKFEDRAAIEEIYWKVFGTSNVINNEIPTWIVCGFIAQGKGVDINWVKATEPQQKRRHTEKMQRVVGVSHSEEKTCISPY